MLVNPTYQTRGDVGEMYASSARACLQIYNERKSMFARLINRAREHICEFMSNMRDVYKTDILSARTR